jgi:hypothetical protein
LFEDNIASVKSGGVYMTSNLWVHVWKNVKKLATTPSSIVVETKNTEIAEIDVDVTSEHDETELTVVVLFITSVEQIELYPICVQCSKKLFTDALIPWFFQTVRRKCPQILQSQMIISSPWWYWTTTCDHLFQI